ncbi:hypothetical protein E3N88_24504 [Mikania micrantha]|uniref:Integrase catalytic domain-containing protein n=1 Tax=Mikania micrantha TaxID=192012 RepID=A0A5N6N3H2_9ASTR|nr:hypothetical protein E3N88_24504 [Mikania micrantha]
MGDNNGNHGRNNANGAVAVRDGGSISYQCPMLTASNYTSWAIKMESIMDAQGIWDAIEPPDNTEVDVKIRKKARAFIFQTLPEDILLQVAKHKEAKEVWDALKIRNLGADRVQKARIQTLNREFELLSMKENESVDDFSSRIGTIASKFRALGSTIAEATQVKKLLNSAPDRLLPIVASIEQYSDLETMPFEEAVGRLKAFEERVKPLGQSKSSSDQLLFSRAEGQKQAGRGRGTNASDHFRGRGRGRGRYNSRGRGGRFPSNSFRKDDQRNQTSKQEKRCYNCDKYGHFAADCRAPRRNEDEANFTTQDDDQTLLMVTKDMVLLNEEKVFPNVYAKDKSEAGTWYLDNGASNHMTGNREFFSELIERTGRVRFGDGSAVNIKGKGSILLQCKNGDQKLITNVYYIPELCNNILSLGQFDEGGCKIIIKDGTLCLYEKSGAALMKVKRTQNRLYKINLQTALPICFLAKVNEKAWLWHARLGHLNFDALNKLTGKKMAEGIPLIDHHSQLCDACLVGKQRSSSLPSKASYRASQPLELIHADLCGPITPSTPAGNKYFLLLVDDFSRFMWIRMLKTKDEAYGAFRIFKEAVEKETGYKVKALRTDRGGEFTSTKFEQLCSEHGIKRFLTAPYTPQQNGVVERRNQTVLGTTRSLLKTMKMPRWMWGEGVRHAVYVLNRTPTKAVEDMTPYEALKRRKPKLNYLKVFGCTAHVKVPSVKLTKLDDRSEPMVYLGSEPGSKAYRLYNPRSKRVVVSRDAKFEEDKPWSWLDELKEDEDWVDFSVENESHFDSAQTSPNQSEGNSVESNSSSPNQSEGNSVADSSSTLNSSENNSSPLDDSNQSFLGPNSPISSANYGSVDGSPVSSSHYDDTPPKGFRDMNDVHSRTQVLQQIPFSRPYFDDSDHLLLNEEPATFSEANDDEEWRLAMQEELRSIEKNNTWRLVQPPNGVKPIGLRWVYKTKKDAKGNITRYKARLVAKGYVQKQGAKELWQNSNSSTVFLKMRLNCIQHPEPFPSLDLSYNTIDDIFEEEDSLHGLPFILERENYSHHEAAFELQVSIFGL